MDKQVLGFDERNWENIGSTEWPVWVREGIGNDGNAKQHLVGSSVGNER